MNYLFYRQGPLDLRTIRAHLTVVVRQACDASSLLRAEWLAWREIGVREVHEGGFSKEEHLNCLFV